LIDETIEFHEPVMIRAKRGKVVLISAQDWNSIQETLYLESIPGMRESIKAGMEEVARRCAKRLDWR
jgi:PHD/YefM family antitoxin component YafN of YafNO toxin-antitoxin module